jgi:uncharacterized protein YecT (DUF1311 family)
MEIRASLEGCDAEKLYYGVGVRAEPKKARNCAMLRSQDGSYPFDGAGLLSMIYANGNGAKKDLDLAIHFACYIEGAPLEVAGRIEHLMKIKRDQNGDDTFSVCDDVTSGFLAGLCAVHEQRIAKAAQDAHLEEFSAKLSSAQEAAFSRLRSAVNEYAAKSAANEVDQTGSMRGVFVTQREDDILTAWGELISALEKGDMPKPKMTFAASDRNLNRVYKRIMANPMPYADMPGSVTRDGIRQAERAWIKYRDAWISFAASRYPMVDEVALKSYLTELRTAFLEGFVS